MMAFTAAVDALVTANLVRTAPLFSYQTIGLDSTQVKSDLGLKFPPAPIWRNCKLIQKTITTC